MSCFQKIIVMSAIKMLSSGNYELNLLFSPRLISPLFPFLHFTSLHFTPLQFTSLHFTSLHFISFHFTSLHFTSLHFTSLHFTPLQFTSFHFTSLQFTSLHFTSLHFTSLHFTSLLFFFLFPASSASDVLSMLVYIYLLAHVSFKRSHFLLSTPLFLRKANGLIDGTFLPDFVGMK